MTSKRSALTMVELLAVAAVISTIATIVFPAFGKAKDAAKKCVCLSNAKQLGLGFALYAADYEDCFVPFGTGELQADGSTTLRNAMFAAFLDSENYATGADMTGGLLQPYIKETRIEDCPSAKSIPVYLKLELAYAVNMNLNRYDSHWRLQAISSNSVSNPAETLWMADAVSLMNRHGLSLQRVYYLTPPSDSLLGSNSLFGTAAGFTHGRHFGSANVAWIDGHSSSLKVQSPTYAIEGLYDENDLTPDQMQSKSVGFVSKFQLGSGSSLRNKLERADYYYMLQKPN